MFLSTKLNKKNCTRHRLNLNWHIYVNSLNLKKYFFKKQDISLTNKFLCYSYKDFFQNKYNKKIQTVVSDLSNGNTCKPYMYGDYIGMVHTNSKYNYAYDKYTDLHDVNFTYLCFLRINYIASNIKLDKLKTKIALSAGTYVVVLKQSFDNEMTYVKLPSGQLKFLPSISYAYLGRNGNIYKNNIVWGSWGFKYKFNNHKPIVRGIAMNPVDHPNGGRSKIKKPFKNKYNKIAKKHK